MIPTSIDGTDITGATIDGTDVQEITVDGQTVFTSVPDTTVPNMVHQWLFTEGTGTTSVDDVTNTTGNFVNTVNWDTSAGAGGVYADFIYGDYFDTDIIAGPNIAGSSNRTTIAWIKPEDTSISRNRILEWGTSTGGRWGWTLANGRLTFEITGANYQSNLFPVEGDWSLVACIFDGTTIGDATLYLDGTTESTSGSLAVNTDQKEMYVGARGDTGEGFEGGIDLATIADTALSVSDINDFRSRTKSLYGL